MKVRNVHEREIRGSIQQAEEIVKTYGSQNDRMYPHELWPKVRLEGADGPFGVGRIGVRDKARFAITAFETTATNIHYAWKFIEPADFDGSHKASVEDRGAGKLLFRSVIEMNTRGVKATLLWLLVMRPLHDAVVEDIFDKVERDFGQTPKGNKWSLWVKMLRRIKKLNSLEYRRLRQERLQDGPAAGQSR